MNDEKNMFSDQMHQHYLYDIEEQERKNWVGNMVIRVVEFSRGGYKIRKIFA
jgi:hypothetical protein